MSGKYIEKELKSDIGERIKKSNKSHINLARKHLNDYNKTNKRDSLIKSRYHESVEKRQRENHRILTDEEKKSMYRDATIRNSY